MYVQVPLIVSVQKGIYTYKDSKLKYRHRYYPFKNCINNIKIFLTITRCLISIIAAAIIVKNNDILWHSMCIVYCIYRLENIIYNDGGNICKVYLCLYMKTRRKTERAMERWWNWEQLTIICIYNNGLLALRRCQISQRSVQHCFFVLSYHDFYFSQFYKLVRIMIFDEIFFSLDVLMEIRAV